MKNSADGGGGTGGAGAGCVRRLPASGARGPAEFLRGDEARGSVNFGESVSLTTSQFISLILFVADIILIVLIKCRKNDKVKQKEATETQND